MMKALNSSLTALILGLSTLSSTAAAAENGLWFVRPYVGLSQMSDLDQVRSNGNLATDIQLDSGFVAGLGLGYRYNRHWAAEFAWEYRSNESVTDIDGLGSYPDGNYASNTFFLNGFYYFQSTGAWQPYVGAGLAWLQEVDIDLERDGVERSLSADGDTGVQVFVGVEYTLSDALKAQAELRYGSITGMTLTEEGGNLRMGELDYQPATVQIGLNYSF